jgi:lipid II isoglutaminyl synthase (glutamine-hydrolysing)
MRTRSTIVVGKTLKALMRLRGGGSALPGLVAERIDPKFMQRTLSQLEHGVVLISGTNGKTTTTKMVVELLESQGMKVFTNRTGSNFTRGVTASLLGEVSTTGHLNADIAVLELDEAHAVHFAHDVPPRYCLLLNVLRDQLDRFGEIDYTASLLHTIAKLTTDGVVLNRDDPRLGSSAFLDKISAPLRTYGVSEPLHSQFPSDDQLRGGTTNQTTPSSRIDDTQLDSIDESNASISYGGEVHRISLKLKGIYNVQNAVGAVALTRLIMGKALDESAMLTTLASVEPAFGRGETITIQDQPVELVLVKNPSGFRLSLQSFDSHDTATMIAINDNYADGRDMSWLWDVDFDSLQNGGVSVVSGIRAYDMALRLQYDEIEIDHIDTKLPAALHEFLRRNSNSPKRIFCTYTAMLALRRELSRLTEVSKALS